MVKGMLGLYAILPGCKTTGNETNGRKLL